MSKTRIKIPLPALATREEAEAAMNELAQAANFKRKLAAQRDKLVLEINRRFEGDFADLETALALKTDLLRVWADAHPEEFPKGRKSLDMLSGTLGFRTGTPRLALLNRAWNWEKVTAAVCQFLPNFVRSKPEVDKEAILGQRDEAAIQAVLPRCGLKVSQDESFFVEPKLTALDERITQEAA